MLWLQGFAYIEFLEADAVDNAIMLDNSELRGRQIKVNSEATIDSAVTHYSHS